MTSDGITTRDWREVHQAAIDAVNAPDSRKPAKQRKMLRLLDRLERRYGRLPSLVATRADYVDDAQESEALLQEALTLARVRRDVQNQRLIAHSLAFLYLFELKDARRGREWIAKFRRLHRDDRSGDYADLLSILNMLLRQVAPPARAAPRRSAKSASAGKPMT